MKATDSRDGEHRVTVRVDYRLTLGELAGALAAWCMHHGEFDRKLNRDEATEAVRSTVRTRGIDVTWAWNDPAEMDQGEAEEAREWGEATAERCFGPLFPRGQRVIESGA